MDRPTIPMPLMPLGPSDSYSYPNGVLAYYTPGFVHIHASVMDAAITIPRSYWATIVKVAESFGLDNTEATLLAEAVESFAR